MIVLSGVHDGGPAIVNRLRGYQHDAPLVLQYRHQVRPPDAVRLSRRWVPDEHPGFSLQRPSVRRPVLRGSVRRLLPVAATHEPRPSVQFRGPSLSFAQEYPAQGRRGQIAAGEERVLYVLVTNVTVRQGLCAIAIGIGIAIGNIRATFGLWKNQRRCTTWR